jgi:Ni,Fe-hydrogenase I small subunit
MKYCAVAAGALGLTTTDLMKIEKAMATSTEDGGTQVVWLNGAACTGCTVTLANTAYLSSVQDLLVPWAKAASHVAAAVPASYGGPLTVAQLVAAIDGGVLTDTGANGPLDLVFMETLSTSVGHRAIEAAKSALTAPFVLCIEGAVQTANSGDYCRIGDGSTASDTDTISFTDEVMEFATSSNCVAILAVGTCASFGGIPAAKGSITDARGLISTGAISGGYKKTNTVGLWDYLKANYIGGFIESIEVTYGGTGYTATPTVTISGGTGATATATLTAGVVTSISVTGGGNYTNPTVSIAAPEPGGTQATAVAHEGFNLSTGISNAMWTTLLSKTVCVSGCPPHPDWIVGTIVYLLASAPTFEPPLTDKWHRPFDYYGEYQCTNCIWQTNDPGKNNDGVDLKDILNQDQSIWSKGKPTEGNSPRLYKNKYDSEFEGCLGVMGCKGRKTKADCGYRRWNSDAKNGNGAGWCVQTRGGCHGCTDPRFPDGWGKFFSFV